MKTSRFNSVKSLTFGAAAALSLLHASAQTGTWINLAGGSWATTANWADGAIADGADNTADFSTLDLTAGATVTLDGARTIGHLVFQDATTASHDWTLNSGSGGPLTLSVSSGTPAINVLNRSATLEVVLAGTQGLAKNGSGTLVLSWANTYSGGTTINGGTLSGTASTLPAGTISLAANSTTLAVTSGTLANTINVEAGISGTFNLATGLTYSGVFSGSGTLTLDSNSYLNTRTFNSTANSGFSGALVCRRGHYLFSGANADFSNTDFRIIPSGTTDNSTYLAFTGTGTTRIKSVGDISGGRLQIGSSTVLDIVSGTIFRGTTSTYDVIIEPRTASTVKLTSSGGTLTFDGSSGTVVQAVGVQLADFAPGTPLTVVKMGAHTLSLQTNNTHTGGTTLAAGRLNINYAGALGPSTTALTINGGGLGNTSGATITLANNNPQNWNGDFSFEGSSELNLGTGNVTLSGTRQVTVKSSTLRVGGVISGSGYGLTKAGAGTLIINRNSGNTFTGPVTVVGGILTLGSLTGTGTVTLNTPSVLTVKDGATLDLPMLHATTGQTATWTLSPIALESGATLRFRASTGSDTHNLAADISTIGNATINNNGGSYANNINLSGRLSGSGTINCLATSGSGSSTTTRTLTLNNTETTYSGDWFVDYTGSTSDDYVALRSTAAGALGTGTVTLEDRARLVCDTANGLSSLAGVSLLKNAAWVDVNQDTTIQSLQGAVGVVSNNTANPVTLTVNSGAFSGAIRNYGGALSLVKATAGTLTLGGANDYTGTTTVNGGTLLVNGSLAAGSSVTVASGALGGTGTINRAVIVETGGTLSPGATGIGQLTVNDAVTLTGATALEVNKAVGPVFTGDLVTGITALNVGGTVTVAATGVALEAGDEFTVFSAGTFSGSFAGITPAPGTDLAWDTSKLAKEGKLLVHHRPAAEPWVASVVRGATTLLSSMKLLTTASDADGDTLTIVAVTAALGSASLESGNINYTAPGSGTSDTITYTISDSRGGLADGVVAVTLTSPDAPSLNIVSPPKLEDNQFKVTFAGIPGMTYTVQDSTVSPSGPWSFYTEMTAGPNGLMQLVATNYPPVGARYFRTVYP